MYCFSLFLTSSDFVGANGQDFIFPFWRSTFDSDWRTAGRKKTLWVFLYFWSIKYQVVSFVARLDQLKNTSAANYFFENAIPALSHRGNLAPAQDDDSASYKEGAERDCAICMDRPRGCLLCPCHHMITCFECAKSLLNRRDGCPICRKDITEVLKVYHS